MSRLKELGPYKNTILATIIQNENLMKALVHNVPNFLDLSPVDSPADQIYDRLWPFKYVPKVVEEEKTFITLSLTGFKPVKRVFKASKIFFYVFTHNELMKTDYGMTRVDFIQSELDTLFNESNELGIGSLEFAGLDDFIFETNHLFVGSALSYRNMDFN